MPQEELDLTEGLPEGLPDYFAETISRLRGVGLPVPGWKVIGVRALSVRYSSAPEPPLTPDLVTSIVFVRGEVEAIRLDYICRYGIKGPSLTLSVCHGVPTLHVEGPEAQGYKTPIRPTSYPRSKKEGGGYNIKTLLARLKLILERAEPELARSDEQQNRLKRDHTKLLERIGMKNQHGGWWVDRRRSDPVLKLGNVEEAGRRHSSRLPDKNSRISRAQMTVGVRYPNDYETPVYDISLRVEDIDPETLRQIVLVVGRDAFDTSPEPAVVSSPA